MTRRGLAYPLSRVFAARDLELSELSDLLALQRPVGDAVQGTLRGHQVDLRLRGRRLVEIEVRGCLEDLELSPAWLPSGFWRVTTGIRAFDERVSVKARSEDVMLAFLGHRARAAAEELVRRRGGWLRRGRIGVVVYNALFAEAVARDVVDLVELASVFARPPAGQEGQILVERLRSNALDDPDDDFRLRCLRSLVTAHAEAPATRDCCARSLLDSDPRVVLLAATFLGRQAVRLVRARIRQQEPPGMQAALAQTLGMVGSGRDEVRLARLLTSQYPEVRRAAAQALAQVGSSMTVEALEKFGRKWPSDRKGRAAAARAARRIRARDAIAGGHVSFSQDEAADGKVSRADAPGILSHPGRA